MAALRTWLADRIQAINWTAVGITLAIEGVLLAALFSLGIASLMDKPAQERLTVLDVQERRQEASPPAQSAPVPDEVMPVVQPQPQVDIVAPKPVMELARAEEQIAAVAEPQPVVTPAVVAAPKAAPAAAPAAPGPVSVPNLNTNLLSGAPPAYPNASRRKREQGTVVLRLVISEDGRVVSAVVSRSSGFAALDEAAVAAVRKWRWSPTMSDGRAVSITGLVQIPFVLKET